MDALAKHIVGERVDPRQLGGVDAQADQVSLPAALQQTEQARKDRMSRRLVGGAGEESDGGHLGRSSLLGELLVEGTELL
jgi:hypothetical protein